VVLVSVNELDERVAAVRQFNRFYTRQIGVLPEEYLGSPYSLTEVRVLYEIAHVERNTASGLARSLELDQGYLSRILRGFGKGGLIDKTPSATDGRQSWLSLTDRGREVLAPLEATARAQVSATLSELSSAEQQRLLSAMREIEVLLSIRPAPPVGYVLRAPQPGDLGWVVQQHGAVYAQEYRWDERFEGLVAEIVAHFVEHFDTKHERCWIAEVAGEPVGSVFLVKQSDTTAKLRLLLVEPRTRGLGIGARLVEDCIRFARLAGYKKITLWTNRALVAARRIYEKAGFQLIASQSENSFGDDWISETWELEL
jgi:DNA-binding MarR family transcriptional regulator/GNAT superfamily N-acetyltransferase